MMKILINYFGRSGLVFLLFWITSPLESVCQKNAVYFNDSRGVQYGYGIKFSMDFSKVEGVNFRLGLSGGLGAYWGRSWTYPSLNADIMLYRGGIGSSHPAVKRHFMDIETIFSYTFTVGGNNRLRFASPARPGIRNYPLYYFSNFTMPSLQNPFRYSFSLGGNIIFFPTRPDDRFQLAGFLNLHADRWQISYVNDGPPFVPPFGDKYDRFHTGVFMGSFHGDDHWKVNLVELTYNKFTGYAPSAYELSNMIGNSFVFYKDSIENYYNKSFWQLTVGNTAQNWGVAVTAQNQPKLDIQHRIHSSMYYPLHLVPYNRGWALGGIGYYQKSKIGLK